MVRGEREVRELLQDAGLVVIESWRTPHRRFRCLNPHGVEVTYTHGSTPGDQRAISNARSIIRKLARLTQPQAGARL